MKRYRLLYQEPYEYDDGGSDGHEILWQDRTHTFEAETDEEAIAAVRVFLNEMRVTVGDDTEKRNPLKLEEFYQRELDIGGLRRELLKTA